MTKYREWDHMWNGEHELSPDDLLPPLSRLVLAQLETRLGGAGATRWRERYSKALGDWNRVSERLNTLVDALGFTLEAEDEARQEWYADHPQENIIPDTNERIMNEMIDELKAERMDHAITLCGLASLVYKTSELWAEPWDQLIKDRTNGEEGVSVSSPDGK